MPIVCTQCRIGPYARLRAALYACQRCGAQRHVAEFELASGERLTLEEGRLCIQRDRAVPDLFTVEPTHGVQDPICAPLSSGRSFTSSVR
ncbi:hypothetical protein SAMN04490356_0522 [Streptomyces melanosporofaciens]|uniref:Uncharacterized protein n=2 Tax=Streptomyces melanosporofaciens TaxID=67327 RepID=A0A1H4ICI5_STRMJ|nr:hypothetical protein SAMN04490356_0522 [Streptomyces melanosporofaciens]